MARILRSDYHRNARKQSERGVPPNVIVSLREKTRQRTATFGDMTGNSNFGADHNSRRRSGNKRRTFATKAGFSVCGDGSSYSRLRQPFLISRMPRHALVCRLRGFQRRLRRAREYRSAGIKCLQMIRIAPTDEAYDAIASTLPKGAARWPMQRDRD
jgi:hypothetical protein